MNIRYLINKFLLCKIKFEFKNYSYIDRIIAPIVEEKILRKSSDLISWLKSSKTFIPIIKIIDSEIHKITN